MTLDARVELRVSDRFRLVVDVGVEEGQTVALLGPNGAGKSTLIRALAGLVPIDAGHIVVDGDVLDDPVADVFVPPEHRPVGVVFQDHLLFPRLSVLDNVAFGLRTGGRSRSAARTRASDVLDQYGLGELAAEMPGRLSGGQSQRVAVARAVATEPRLLLLDEPLAALDVTTRAEVRSLLRADLARVGGARLLVTHDPIDALVLADHLVIVEGGEVRQRGTPSEVATRPASRYVADLVGVTLLEGRASGERTVRLATGVELAVADRLPGTDVAVAVRPRAVTLHRERPEGSARNVWSTTVAGVEAEGDRVRVALTDPQLTAEVTAASVAELGLVEGAAVWASVKAVDVVAYLR